MPDPAETHPYKTLGPETKWYAVIARGRIACRWGPFDGLVAGKIMEQALAEGIPVSFVADCGPDFDWEVARDMRGYPEGEDPTRQR